MKDVLLIVDDEADLLSGLKRSIEMELDCLVLTASNGFEAVELLTSNTVDLVLTDISMPKMDGMSLLERVLEIDSAVSVIMMTAYGTIELAVKALKLGAYDFIQKPFDFDNLVRLLQKGFERNRLLRENDRLQRRMCEQTPLENLVGKSNEMQSIHEQIKTLAKTDVAVLITGETGTGKDIAANAIHALSARRSRKMVTVNCPALPEGLLESELFGHKKGAFTGADKDKPGLFEEAENSTIFLDEIGDLPLELQTKLLRILQNHEVQPIGAGKSHKVNVRVIAATNQNLPDKIERGLFRADLYYRLNVASLEMPPLSKLRDDIPLLTNHFLHKSACELNIQPKTIAQSALNLIVTRDWPGNTRELENFVRALTATIPEPQINLEHLNIDHSEKTAIPVEMNLQGSYKDLKDQVIEQFTREYVCRLLHQTKGNVSQSAQVSGIKRQSLQKIINRYQIDVSSFR